MKYDVYHGTKKDFEESEGKLIKGAVSEAFITGYLGRNAEAAISGELIPFKHVEYGDGFVWIEEAM